jgi:hypothetical protein
MHLCNPLRIVQVNAPELKGHAAFVAWLNAASGNDPLPGPLAATWHRPWMGEIGEYSDLYITKDTGHEGSDSDMPEDVWNAVVALVGADYVGVIRMTFEGEEEPEGGGALVDEEEDGEPAGSDRAATDAPVTQRHTHRVTIVVDEGPKRTVISGYAEWPEAWAAVVRIARENWHNRADRTAPADPSGLSEAALVEAYFEGHENESYQMEQLEIEFTD